MTAPDLDLTVATEAAGQALYENWAARRLREATTPTLLLSWDDLPRIARHNWRNMALPVVIAAQRDIARQAWEIGVEAAMENVLNADVADTNGPHNPFAEPDDWDAAAAQL